MTPALVVPVLGRKLYPGASVALDFTRNLYRSGTPVVKGSPSLLSGWTFTRASTGYAETAAGALVAFASGAPRITDKGLLVEESRINLALQSQTLQTTWTLTSIDAFGSGSVVDATTAPDNTATADFIRETSSASTAHRIEQSITTTAVATTVSVYAKPNGRNWVYLRLADSGNVARLVYFNVSTGTIGTTETGWTATITAMGNGWYRCTGTITAFAGANSLRIGLASADNNSSYAGDGTSGIYLWGAQLEAGAFATSYIPTTTASATRLADVATIATTSLAYPLTLVVNSNLIALPASTARQLSVDDGTSNNRADIYSSSTARIFMRAVSGGVDQADTASGVTVAAGTAFKAAFRVATNDMAISLNGAAVTADAVATLPATPANVRVGSQGGSGSFANAYIQTAIIYPSGLTNAQLQAAST